MVSGLRNRMKHWNLLQLMVECSLIYSHLLYFIIFVFFFKDPFLVCLADNPMTISESLNPTMAGVVLKKSS